MLVYKDLKTLKENVKEPFTGMTVFLVDKDEKKVYDGKNWVAYDPEKAREGLPSEEIPKPFREDPPTPPVPVENN